MMNGYDGLSPSDVALLSRNNDNGGFGGDGWWAILLLLAFLLFLIKSFIKLGPPL